MSKLHHLNINNNSICLDSLLLLYLYVMVCGAIQMCFITNYLQFN